MKIIFAYIFGIGAMIALFSIYQQSSRKKLIVSKLIADVCWVIHYLCLGAYGGAIPNFVGIFRELVFVNRENKKWANLTLWPFVFIIANLLLGLRTFAAPINLLPILGSAFVTIALWLKKPILTKIMSFPVSTAFLIYDIFVGSIIGIISESISLISIIIALIKIIKERFYAKRS